MIESVYEEEEDDVWRGPAEWGEVGDLNGDLVMTSKEIQ